MALRRPAGAIIGLICQYGSMPLLTFLLAHLLAQALALPPAYAMGLILTGCRPGGTTSKIGAYFRKGTLSFSILVTGCR
jgi:predicted Na+-dependent transporter